jgi:hypothetical protein
MSDSSNHSSQNDDAMVLLSRLLLQPGGKELLSFSAAQFDIAEMSKEKFDALVALANTNHVIVRGLEVFLRITHGAQQGICTEWAAGALQAEQSRIHRAMVFLHAICAALAEEGYEATVIKSLDHWPDLGSDLDLYTNGNSEEICRFMNRRFQARTAARSWGDRLASKWNFLIPGLPEAVEVHIGRLGQTGEQMAIASWLPARARLAVIGDYRFRVPAVSDRLMISTLQRMYRHFYFRLCDIVDTAKIASSGAIDYDDLRSSAMTAGIWEGVATYLVIVSDYLRQYRGSGIGLPDHAAIGATLRFTTLRIAPQAGAVQQCEARPVAMACDSGPGWAKDYRERQRYLVKAAASVRHRDPVT